MKDNPSVSKLIEESEFNIETMDKVEVSNDKLKDMFKSKAAPGISTNSTSPAVLILCVVEFMMKMVNSSEFMLAKSNQPSVAVILP